MHHPTDRITHTTAFVYTSHGTLAGTRNSLWVHHEGSFRRPIPPWANAHTMELHLAPLAHSSLPDKLRNVSSEETGRDIQLRGRISTYDAVGHWIDTGQLRERERNVLFNDALNTFYLRLYGVRHMVKDHSDSEKGNPLLPHRLLLSINSKGSFICTIPQTG